MTALEKRKEEQGTLIQERKNRILKAAFDLFADKGIDTIAMTDIAKTAEIGVASLYRYYETKDEIAIRTAIWAWQKQIDFFTEDLKSPEYEKLTGIQQISKILGLFVKLYETNHDFLRFIYFFDSYAVRQQISTERLAEYEQTIGLVQNIVKNAINKAIKDKSINQEYKDREDELYFTLMHTMFNTSQKLSLSLGMLEMNNVVSGSKQLILLSELLIKSLN